MGVSVGLDSRWTGSPALAAENAGESFLELAAEARVDDGVDAAVEVAQPEGYLKNSVRRLIGREDGAWKRHTNTPKYHQWNNVVGKNSQKRALSLK